jgi:serine/threonine-protein kinase
MPADQSIRRLVINRYVIHKQLGSGGMADIFLARDPVLERLVAIKRLRRDFSGDATFQQRFKLEAKAAANLSHPNIVTIYDFGFDDGMPIIVMEYVPGVDLKSIIQKQGQLDISLAIQLMIQACAGVGYAHRAGLIHCDIKPQNMLVTPDHILKVTDFGIARALAGIHPDEKHDVVWGSPYYLSPEQASGLAPSPASDVYSLGVVLYEMVTGSLPFIASTADELMEKHKTESPLLARTKNPEVPELLEQILAKILSKNASNRYRTADQLGRVLITVQENLTDKLKPVFPTIPTHLPPSIPVNPENLETKESNVDWSLVGWSLLALFAVGGLVPFWLYIYLSLFNPIQ